MAISFIPFDGWKPSGGVFGEGWAGASNIYSSFSSWRPARGFNGTGAGVTDYPLNTLHGHVWMSGAGSTSYLPDALTMFTGSDTKLYTVDAGGTFANVSRAALYGPLGAAWRFASVGNDIYAANWLDVLQRRTNNAGLFADGPVSTFKPRPRFLKTVREHLVVANFNQAGRFQDEVAWSDADDPTNFDAPTTTSTSIAGSKRLVSIPGQIYGLLGGQYGLAFKRRGTFYLEYTGTSQVFRPDVLSQHVGTAYPGSIVNSRYGIFFLGPDGFYKIAGLSEPVKISPPGVDQLLIDSSFTSFVAANFTPALEDAQIIGVEHPMLPLIGWLYKTESSQFGASGLLWYDPTGDSWSIGGTGSVFLSALAARPYSTDIYQALVGISSPSGVVSKLSTWSGSVQGPVLQLRYRPANFEDAGKYKQSQVKGVLPMFSKVGGTAATALTTSVTVESMLDPYAGVWTTETRVATNRDTISGWYPFQSAGRLFRITITCTATEDFDHFDGVWVDQDLLL